MVSFEVHLLPASGVLTFVIVASVCSDEIARLICHDRTLVTIEFIYRKVCAYIDGISEHICKPRTPPRFTVLQDAMLLKISDDITVGTFGLGVEFVNQFDLFSFIGFDFIHGCFDTLDSRRHQLKSIRHSAAHIEALLTAGEICVCDSLLNRFAFQLCEHNADVEHGSAHRGGGIKFFGGGYELNFVLFKALHHRGEVQNRAADAVQLIDNYFADDSIFDIIHHFRKGRAVCVFAAVAPVGIYFVCFTSHLIFAELNLAFDRNTVGSVNGLSRVDCVHLVAPFT